MASQAAVYVHAIAMLTQRGEAITASLRCQPGDPVLEQEYAALQRSLSLFRARLQRTEEPRPVSARRG